MEISKKPSTSAYFEAQPLTPTNENELKTKSPNHFKCVLCNKLFASDINLKYHTETSHNPKSVVKVVDLCKDKVSETEHHAKENSIEKNNCDQCEKLFVTKMDLKEHKKLHCEQCGQVFVNLMQLKKHETISGHY